MEAGIEAGVAAAAVTGPGRLRTDLVMEIRVIIMVPNKDLLGTRGLRNMLTSMGDPIKMLFNIMGLSRDRASIREPSTSPGSITTTKARVEGGQILGTTTSSRAEAGAERNSTADTDTTMDTMASIIRIVDPMVTIIRTGTRITAARHTAAEDEVTTAVAGPAATDRGGRGDRRTSRTWLPRRLT